MVLQSYGFYDITQIQKFATVLLTSYLNCSTLNASTMVSQIITGSEVLASSLDLFKLSLLWGEASFHDFLNAHMSCNKLITCINWQCNSEKCGLA